MATRRVPQPEHDGIFKKIDDAMASDQWEKRLFAIEMVLGVLRDLPTERTVERLVEILNCLARDTKWEVRRAVVPALVDVGRPAARSVIEQMTGDGNRWVRQAAERALRKVARKRDKKARSALGAITDLEGAADEIYDAAVLVGEKYYEELVGDTAHELNTYRAAMEVLLQELERRVANGNGAPLDVSDIMGKIHDRSRYLNTLCTGLVEYTRDADLDFQLQPLGPIVSSALELAREKASASLSGQNIEVIDEIPGEIQLEACKDRLHIALVNILSNAFESLAGKRIGAKVRISVEAGGSNRLLVTIADTGCGMDSAQVDSATKRFRSLKTKQGGIGLGLPLALKIIEREHKGQLDIKSEPEAGTTVTVRLPMRGSERK